MSHYIRLTCEARADLQMCAHFLEHYNGRSVFLPEHVTSSQTVMLFTDAIVFFGFFFAGILNTEWFALRWDTVSELDPHLCHIHQSMPIGT